LLCANKIKLQNRLSVLTIDLTKISRGRIYAKGPEEEQWNQIESFSDLSRASNLRIVYLIKPVGEDRVVAKLERKTGIAGVKVITSIDGANGMEKWVFKAEEDRALQWKW
jgi:hypothetical protein